MRATAGFNWHICANCLLMVALLLAGCATAPLQDVVTDTFCLTAKKRSWDPDTDSVATMREAVVWNRQVDLRCGVPGKVASK
jgi:hypothetical protein